MWKLRNSLWAVGETKKRWSWERYDPFHREHCKIMGLGVTPIWNEIINDMNKEIKKKKGNQLAFWYDLIVLACVYVYEWMKSK